MIKAAVPTLSPAGWVSTPAEMADTMMAHSCLANKSQTALYGGNVFSVQWLVERYGQDIPTLLQKLREGYEDYFRRYFPENIDVDVQGDASSEADAGKINIRIIIVFTNEGKQYSVASVVNTVNGKFAKLQRLNRDGTFA